MSRTDVVQNPKPVDCLHVVGQGERGAQDIELRHPVWLNYEYILNYFKLIQFSRQRVVENISIQRIQ